MILESYYQSGIPRKKKGLYSLDEGGKLGESGDMDDRTDCQKYITREVIIVMKSIFYISTCTSFIVRFYIFETLE